jgi:hypothetical protein
MSTPFTPEITFSPRFEMKRPVVDYGYFTNNLYAPQDPRLFNDIAVPLFFTGTIKQLFEKTHDPVALDQQLDELAHHLPQSLKFYAADIQAVPHKDDTHLVVAYADDSTIKRFREQSAICKVTIGKKAHIQRSVALGKTTDPKIAETVARRLRSSYTGEHPAALLHFSGVTRA